MIRLPNAAHHRAAERHWWNDVNRAAAAPAHVDIGQLGASECIRAGNEDDVQA